MTGFVRKYKNIVCQAVPSLLAICIVELVNVEVYLSGPVSQGAVMLLVWITLQMIPGFVFGYISDQHYRKASLIISQLLGFLGGLFMVIFGFETWVLILVALTFNPLPVARAALLDHFPQHSTVKLVAITFIAQYLPWVFFHKLSFLSERTVIHWVLALLALNTFLTAFLFKGDTKGEVSKEKSEKIELFSPKRRPVMYMLIAFIFAETAFYLLWSYLEYDPNGRQIISITNSTTILGMTIAMLYTRLPHLSIITLLYSIGAAIALVALYQCLFDGSLCEQNLINSMIYYCIVGGLYLPFVTDGVIRMLGSGRRAFGSALIEFGDTMAGFLAPLMLLFFKNIPYLILTGITVVFVSASIFQWCAEKKSQLNHLRRK